MDEPRRSPVTRRSGRIPRAGRMLTALGAIAVGIVSAGTCPTDQFVIHILDGTFEHCRDDVPLYGHFFLLSDPAGVNSAAVSGVCREFPSVTSQLIDCQPVAGTPGDNHVTIQFDWGGVGPAFPGCPNPLRAGNGTARMHTHTVTADGTSILTSLTFQVDMALYPVEFAQPWTGTVSLPIACDEPERRLLRIDGTSTSGATTSVDLTLLAPKISTDCDPGTGGASIEQCAGGEAPAVITPGRVYLQQGHCGGLPVPDLRTAAWTLLSDGDAQGHASVSFPAPAWNECVYLGATYRFDGQEAPAIGGFVTIPSAACGDADGDGVSACDQDCDDADPRVFPGAGEICDGLDNDCDSLIDEDLGTLTCGRGAFARVTPSCSDGSPQVCAPGPPSPGQKRPKQPGGPPPR